MMIERVWALQAVWLFDTLGKYDGSAGPFICFAYPLVDELFLKMYI